MRSPGGPTGSAGRPILEDAAALLGCPECGSAVELLDRALICLLGHNFDVARQGYVSLLTGAATKMVGDSAEMLAARADFQQAGHFGPIAAAVADACADADAVAADQPAVVEIGSGTGYYLAHVLETMPAAVGIGLDVAKPAARRCARAHPRAASVVADVWQGLPIRSGVLSHVLSIFAPRNAGEVHRVLAPDATFIVVTPTVNHLAELIEPLGLVRVDADKPRRLSESLSGRFERTGRTAVEYRMPLGHTDIEAVVAMGPSAHHRSAQQRAELIAALPVEFPVTASVVVSAYRRITPDTPR